MNTFLFTCLLSIPALAQIPVTTCGDTLDVAGGFYVLTGNLTCPTVPAIHVTANHVTFNLQGFTLAKSGEIKGAAIITAAGPTCVPTSGVSISGGTIAGFGTAVSICAPSSSAAPSTSTHAQIHHLTLTGNGIGVALLNADDNNVHHNTITAGPATATVTPGVTPGTGILLEHSGGNLIQQNEVKANAGDGIAIYRPPAITTSPTTILRRTAVRASGLL